MPTRRRQAPIREADAFWAAIAPDMESSGDPLAVRAQRLEQYDQVDRTRPEAASALDLWADLVSGGGASRTVSAFDLVILDASAQGRPALLEAYENVSSRLLPTDQKYLLARDLVKSGEVFEQIVTRRHGRGISALVPMPTGQMRVEDDGSFSQVPPGVRDPVARWPEWRIAHFRNARSRASRYGSSVLEPCLRALMQVESLEASLLTRRLERASLRYKHVVDVSHLSDAADIEQARQAYARGLRRRRTVDGTRNFRLQRINMPLEDDLVIARRDRQSAADIEVLQGEAQLDQIADFHHFFHKWLSGLGPPRAHLGFEAGTLWSVLGDQHMVFARKARRVQAHLIQGLTHLVWLDMVLRGGDPAGVRFAIFPPQTGTRDELLRAQVMLAHAQVVRHLSQAFSLGGNVPDVRWFLRHVMSLDEDAIAQLKLGDLLPSPQLPARDLPPETDMLASLQNHEDLARTQGQLAHLLEQRAVDLRLPSAAPVEAAWPVRWNPGVIREQALGPGGAAC